MFSVGLLLFFYLFFAMPAFVIAQRRGQKNAWAAFVPWVGPWIVLVESMGQSGWLSLLVFTPYVGPLVMIVWTGVEMPQRHGRSGWWRAALAVPVVNFVALWLYALTLDQREKLAFAA